MTTLGWSAFGSLIMEVASQSDTLYEALAFTNMAIAVCAVIAALIAVLGSAHGEDTGLSCNESPNEEGEDIRALAEEVRCAESRARLLSLAERFN